jgi:transcriptional regulator with XRE-family HTH domain
VGGTGSGRWTDEARRRATARLRAAGLTFAEIGRALGVTKQRVAQMLRERAATTTAVRCRACGGVLASGLGRVWRRPAPLCPPCLARTPGVHFGERLRTHRLLVGLTQEQLALEVGVTDLTVSLYERGVRRPRSQTLVRLVAVLGAGLAEGA